MGDGYVGMIVYFLDVWEFFVVQLIVLLELGEVYILIFQVSFLEWLKFWIDDFGVMLLYNWLEQDSLSKYYYLVKNFEGCVFLDIFGWMEVWGQYLVEGGEEYLFIGNLYDQVSIIFEEIGVDNVLFWVYYYVDQVVLE